MRRPTRSTLFPYTTLFRSRPGDVPMAARMRPVSRRCSAPSASSTVPDAEGRSEEHTSELQSQSKLVCRLLLEKKTREPLEGRDRPLVVDDVEEHWRLVHRG